MGDVATWTNYMLSVVKQTPDGIASQMWSISEEQAEKITHDLGPADSEMFAPREVAEGLHDSAHAGGVVFADDCGEGKP